MSLLLGFALVMQLSESFLLPFFPKLLLAMVFITAVDTLRASEMAQPVKVLIAMPEEMSSNPRIYIQEEEKSQQQVVSDLCPIHVCCSTQAQTNMQNKV